MQKNTKAKLTFEMLEKEMELISVETMSGLKGGDILPADCMYQAISFATGISAQDVQLAYAAHIIATHSTGMDLGQASAYAGFMGVNTNDVQWLMNHYGLTSGYSSTGSSSTSSSGDAGVVLLDTNGDGHADHAMNLTGNATSGWYYYDRQSSTGGGGIISANDPRIVGTYGFSSY